jgi:hypothetical protein
VTIWTWRSQTYHDGSIQLGGGGQSSTRSVFVPVDEALQRVIYRRSCGGSLDVDDPDKIPKPAEGYAETVFDVHYLTDEPDIVYTDFRHMQWGQGWTLVQSLQNKAYWTWHIGAGFFLDIDIRRAPAGEDAHALSAVFTDSISFDDQGVNADRAFPSYSSWTSLRWLTSKMG